MDRGHRIGEAIAHVELGRVPRSLAIAGEGRDRPTPASGGIATRWIRRPPGRRTDPPARVACSAASGRRQHGFIDGNAEVHRSEAAPGDREVVAAVCGAGSPRGPTRRQTSGITADFVVEGLVGFEPGRWIGSDTLLYRPNPLTQAGLLGIASQFVADGELDRVGESDALSLGEHAHEPVGLRGRGCGASWSSLRPSPRMCILGCRHVYINPSPAGRMTKRGSRMTTRPA